MNFEEFAAGYGLIIERVEYGAWRRVKTVDHPHKRNGAYLHRGTWHGAESCHYGRA